MNVRPATVEDLPRLLGWAGEFLAYHPLTSQFPHDLLAIETMLRRLIEGEDAALLMHERGAIGGIIAPMWCSPDVRVANELFWWSEGNGMSLMKAFEAWAGEHGAQVVNMVMIVGKRDVSPIYDRAGYTPVELSYVRAA